MVLWALYLILFVTIVSLQFQIPVAYYSHAIKNHLANEDIELDDSFFNFKIPPSQRNLKNDDWFQFYNCTGIFQNVLNKNKTKDQFEDNKLKHIRELTTNDLKHNNSKHKRRLRSSHKRLTITYMEISQISMLNEWVYQLLLPQLYDNSERIFFNQNFIIGDPQLYLGIRYVNGKPNNDENTNSVFPDAIPANEYTLFDKIGDELGTDPIQLSTDDVYYYIQQGNYSTFAGAGGYVFPYPRDSELAYNKDYLSENSIVINIYVVNYYFSFLWINRNNKNIILNVMEIDYLPSGEITPKFYFYTIGQYYKDSLDYFRMVLEIIFLIQSWWYIYLVLKCLVLFVFTEFKTKLDSQSDSLKTNNIIFRLLKIDVNHSRGEIKSSLFCKKTIKCLFKYALRLISSIFKFIINLNNLVNLWCSILVCILASRWIEINTENTFEIDENAEAPEAMEYVYLLQSLIDNYRMLWTIFAFCMFMKFIKFLDFSFKISIFFETVKSSSYDLLFIIPTFLLILFGYWLIGNSLFGLLDKSFSYVPTSFMSIFEIISGATKLEDIITYNKAILYVYGLALTFTMIILLNILIAIILSHYFEYYANQGDLDANFLKLFLKNFIEKESIQKINNKSGTFKQTWSKILKSFRNWVWDIQEMELSGKGIARCKSFLLFCIFACYIFISKIIEILIY